MNNKYGVLPDNVIMDNIMGNIRYNSQRAIYKYKHETSKQLRPSLINDLKRLGYRVNQYNDKKGKYIYEIFW